MSAHSRGLPGIPTPQKGYMEPGIHLVLGRDTGLGIVPVRRDMGPGIPTTMTDTSENITCTQLPLRAVKMWHLSHIEDMDNLFVNFNTYVLLSAERIFLSQIVFQWHPAGRALTSDWTFNSFVIVACEKSLKSCFGQKILAELKKYTHGPHRKTTYKPVKSECSSHNMSNKIIYNVWKFISNFRIYSHI